KPRRCWTSAPTTTSPPRSSSPPTTSSTKPTSASSRTTSNTASSSTTNPSSKTKPTTNRVAFAFLVVIPEGNLLFFGRAPLHPQRKHRRRRRKRLRLHPEPSCRRVAREHRHIPGRPLVATHQPLP